MPNMICQKCGSRNTRMMGLVTLSAPTEFHSNFSKTNLRRKDVYLQGVCWETFDIICCEPKCGHVTDAYGNYVTNMKKENESLKKEIEVLKKEIESLKKNLVS